MESERRLSYFQAKNQMILRAFQDFYSFDVLTVQSRFCPIVCVSVETMAVAAVVAS